MNEIALLHVDDEDDIREVAAYALELDAAIRLTSVASGGAALERLEAGYRPDAILLDVMMPGLDGPGTLEQLRTISGLESTPVVFMTARVQADERQHYLNLGALGVITKPFDPLSLASELRSLLAVR